MRRKRPQIVTGLDIGTTKVCAIIGQMGEDGVLEVLGVGSHPSQGMKKGLVVDIEATVDSIKKAVGKASKTAGVPVRNVYVGMAGGHITSLNSVGRIKVLSTPRGVTEQERDNVLASAKNVAVPDNMEIMHAIPQEYVVDDQPGIRNPVGMSCSKLEVRVHVVLAAYASATNIVRCVQLAGLKSRHILLESLASASAILSDQEKDLGVILIDIGGGTSDVAVFAGGSVRYSGVVPHGGDTLTNDISVVHRLSRHAAENVKKKYARVDLDAVDSKETYDAVDVSNSGTQEKSRYELCEVCEARIIEIFEIARKMIAESGVRQVNGGVVLTGGTSLMQGITDVAERIFQMSARVGAPHNIKGLSGAVSSPIYATAIGLVLHGIDHENSGAADASRGGVFGWLWFQIKRIIDWYLE